ncbi:hypothetical protein E2C01_080244 [Portunus trituberculatus]|uniref:Uncharacterized protein n=1 Tax=Portunus trituberculatus TaxID=210409 RepID=A0A5B7IUW7_PORTR|nr:hypothetical protein [Portunus trituberculatus]
MGRCARVAALPSAPPHTPAPPCPAPHLSRPAYRLARDGGLRPASWAPSEMEVTTITTIITITTTLEQQRKIHRSIRRRAFPGTHKLL